MQYIIIAERGTVISSIPRGVAASAIVLTNAIENDTSIRTLFEARFVANIYIILISSFS